MDKRKIKRRLIIEGVLSIFIAFTPIIFYAYKYIPTNAIDSWEVIGLTFTSNGYGKVSYAFYYYFSKLVPLSLLLIWFFTCKHWWYHAILIPISMYAFQLYSIIFSEESAKIDENELKYLLIICMIIVPIVYFIRLKLFDKHVHGIDLDAMDEEIKHYKEKERLREEAESNS